MRRSTRSASGQPTSPVPLLQEERSTRSRTASEDLVVLELPRITRNFKRTGKSPDPPKTVPKGEGTAATTADGSSKPEKRVLRLSPAEAKTDLSTKRRRRSGRLADAEEEKDGGDGQEKKPDEPEELSPTIEKVVERKGKTSKERTKHDDNMKGKELKGKEEKDPEHKEGKIGKSKEEKDGKSKEEKDGRSKEEKDGKSKEGRESKSKAKDSIHEESPKKDQKKKDELAAPRESVGSTRRRTRSGRHGQDEEGNAERGHADVQSAETNQSEKASDPTEPDRESTVRDKELKLSLRGVPDKGKDDSLKLRSPPQSPGKQRKEGQKKIELLKLDLDISEGSAKSGRPSSKCAMSPPLRMSPRRARQPSGQKDHPPESQQAKDPPSASEAMVAVSPSHQEATAESSVAEDKPEEPAKKRTRSSSVCKNLSEEFEGTKKSPRSPTRQTRARRDSESNLKCEGPELTEDELLLTLPKSPKARRSRSPVKSPRDSGQVSPRKGLRSSKPAENGVAPNPDEPVLEAPEDKEEAHVVTVEASQLVSAPIDITPVVEGDNLEDQVVNNEDILQDSLEEMVEEQPLVSEMIAVEEEKEEFDVSEISDDVAAKVQEWKLQEEDSVGFQGDEWYAEEVDEGEPFYFESDHMALKGNKDYRMLLRTITTLEAQRKQAVKDLDKLVTAQREALRNPLKFVQKLQKKDTLHLPSAQRIVLLPEIPWGRYLGHADSKELIQGLSHQTRGSIKQKDGTNENAPPVAGPSTVQTQDPLEDDKLKSVIRGRVWDDSKPETFNRLWTVEEQKRLEELLVKYPSEEVEARRWEKIAKDLGNRTRHQVASRVQKYFIKLSKAGLPVPGRTPNLSTYCTKKPSQRRYTNPFNKLTLAPSTFLQSVRAPVLMTDDDESMEMDLDYDADSIMEDDDVPTELKETAEYRELVRLKKLRNITLKQQTEISHSGYSCDGCGMSPIMGLRWHCSSCPPEVSTDLCQTCANDDFQSEVHASSHQLEAVQSSQSGGFVDSDYTSFTGMSGDYNYLDPNYSPAVL
ncbi:uncharacterized protein [Diadema setosum]